MEELKPTTEEINELLGFLPVLGQEGYEPILEWQGGEPDPGGTLTFPWPLYRREVEEFFRAAGREAWRDYHYMSKNPAENIQEPGYIRAASLDQIKTLLTYCLRGERFCDGFWGSMIEAGHITRLLERLAEIKGGEGLPG